MNAVEFVKKYGWDTAKDLANRDKTSVGYLSVEHHDICQDDLKRLVEYYELVEQFGGIEECKKIIASMRPAVYELTKGDELKQAIVDVEKCQ